MLEEGYSRMERLFRQSLRLSLLFRISKIHAFLQGILHVFSNFSIIFAYFNCVYLGKIVILSSLFVTRRRKIRRSKRKVCTNLGNSTAPRCTSRFRDTGPPRKSRCVRPPNRNYDNCTCNRHVSRKVTPGDNDKSRRFDEMDLINENQWRR